MAQIFYGERADKELGLAFIAEFEHAPELLSANPEIGTQTYSNTTYKNS